jgi:hypothetical protein
MDKNTEVLLDCGNQMARTIIDMVEKNTDQECFFCKKTKEEHSYGCVYLTALYFKDTNDENQ